MADVGLNAGLYNDRLRHTNFFNGRVLTAQDLQNEQAANHEHLALLGQAIGEGVVRGLEVRFDPLSSESRVTVRAGLALNRDGQALLVEDDVDVLLVEPADEAAETGGLFSACVGLPPGATLTDTGAYLLVMGPASDLAERAPRVGLSGNGRADACDYRYGVEGVRFRLLRFQVDDPAQPLTVTRILELTALPEPDERELSRLRNLLAHFCYGTEALLGFPSDPRDAFPAYGALDALRALDGVLADCEVPLALIYWTTDGIRFVDGWCVRRRPATAPISAAWPLHVSPRRMAEAEAGLLQFEEQLEGLEAGGATIKATEHFHYLPPAGYVPDGMTAFFEKLGTSLFDLDEAYARALVFQSFLLEAIDLDHPPPIHLYRVAGSPYVLYARGQATSVAEEPAETEAPEEPATPEAEPEPGRITAVVTPPEEIDPESPLGRLQAARRQGAAREAVLAEIERLFQVFADHVATGRRFPARLLKSGELSDLLSGGKKGAALPTLRFRTEAKLPAGTYRVSLISPPGVQDTQRELAAGQHLTVRFTLTRPTDKPGGKPRRPDRGADAGWMRPKWFEELHMAEEILKRYADWPWRPEKLVRFRRQPDPPPEVLEWLRRWGEEVRKLHPAAPVDAGDPGIYLDESYTPDGPPPAEAYAFAAYGEGGAFVPLLLLPVHRTLDRSVSVGRAGLAGADPDVERRLEAFGIARADLFAAAWSGLVADALEIGHPAAAGLIRSARAEVARLQDGVDQFAGADRAARDAMKAMGVGDAIGLANEEAGHLAAALSERTGREVSAAFAAFLIDEARTAVDPAFWSIEQAETGLGREDVALLERGGLTTLGDLQRAAATEEGRQRLEEMLGASAGAVAALAKTAGDALGGAAGVVRAGRTARAPVSDLAEVSAEAAVALARRGVETKSQLADADAAGVAEAFGGDEAAAGAAIRAARTQLGR